MPQLARRRAVASWMTVRCVGTADALTYDAYGNILTETDASQRGRYAWTGRELDAETGLQYNRARWYDPRIGSWVSQDPMGFSAGDSNLYRYVKNSPDNHGDPSGLDTVTIDGSGNIIWTASSGSITGQSVVIGTYATGGNVQLLPQFGGVNISYSALQAEAAGQSSYWLTGAALQQYVTGNIDHLLDHHIVTAPQAPFTTNVLQALDRGAAGASCIVENQLTLGLIPDSRRRAARAMADAGPYSEGAYRASNIGGEFAATAIALIPAVATGQAIVPILRGAVVTAGTAIQQNGADRGVSVADAVRQGIVRQDGRLHGVLQAIEAEVQAQPPTCQNDAMRAIANAVANVNLEPGQSVGALPGQGDVILQNVGGILTTITSTGEVIIRNAQNQIIFHYVPG